MQAGCFDSYFDSYFDSRAHFLVKILNQVFVLIDSIVSARKPISELAQKGNCDCDGSQRYQVQR